MTFPAVQAFYIYGFESSISLELCLLCLKNLQGETAVATGGA